MVTYTDRNKVGNILGFNDGYFSASSTPTTTVVDNFIERAERRIERETGHAWRIKNVSNEYVRPGSIYRYDLGIRFKLQNRMIRDFSTGDGDKLEVWDGSSWVDFVATKQEGRDKDFFVDYTNGIVFLVGQHRIFEHGVRVTYRYGDSSIPEDIEEATTLLAAITILNSPEFTAVRVTDDGVTRNDGDRISQWKEEVKEIIQSYRELKII